MLLSTHTCPPPEFAGFVMAHTTYRVDLSLNVVRIRAWKLRHCGAFFCRLVLPASEQPSGLRSGMCRKTFYPLGGFSMRDADAMTQAPTIRLILQQDSTERNDLPSHQCAMAIFRTIRSDMMRLKNSSKNMVRIDENMTSRFNIEAYGAHLMEWSIMEIEIPEIGILALPAMRDKDPLPHFTQRYHHQQQQLQL